MGCAGRPPQPSGPPLSSQEISLALRTLDRQEKQADTVFSTGHLEVRTNQGSSKLHFVMIGTRAPLRIKLELTHSWGHPISHVLLQNGKLQVLSVPEKRFYEGSLHSRSSAGFFPSGLESKHLWALARSYPILVGHHQQVSTGSDEIRLLDTQDRPMEVIRLYPGSSWVRRTSFPRQGIDIHYSEYETHDGIPFARTVKLNDSGSEAQFLFRVQQMTFNRSVPAEVFRVHVPQGFEKFPLRTKAPLS
jgi:hypothetical protein